MELSGKTAQLAIFPFSASFVTLQSTSWVYILMLRKHDINLPLATNSQSQWKRKSSNDDSRRGLSGRKIEKFSLQQFLNLNNSQIICDFNDEWWFVVFDTLALLIDEENINPFFKSPPKKNEWRTIEEKIIYKTISLKLLIASHKAKLFPLTLDWGWVGKLSSRSGLEKGET